MFTAPSPDHFAAPGRRVQSVTDPADRGAVMRWISTDTFLVAWDSGLPTACTVLEVDPED